MCPACRKMASRILGGVAQRAGAVACSSVRRLATDALKKGGDGKQAAPLVEPLWKTTAEFKTLSDLPPREVLKAELLQMAEQKNGFLFGEVVRCACLRRLMRRNALGTASPPRQQRLTRANPLSPPKMCSVQPPPPGKSRKWEDWELIWYVGLGGSFLYVAAGLYFKPECKITTWARVEAMRRKAAMDEAGEDWLALMKEGGSAPPIDE